MSRRILITIEYKGTNYKGWQMQKDLPTIQGEITKALEKVCGHEIKLHGSGRTDEGVHAMGQTAHFDCDCTIPNDRFAQSCNVILPDDIKILNSRQVTGDFHARFDVKKKTYLFKIFNNAVTSPLRNDLFAFTPYKLNIEDMKKACEFLTGKHDFAAFMASGCEVKSTVREIFSAKISNFENEIYFEICGNGFLQNMVRIIAGTLVDIGRGRLKVEDLPKIIESKDRNKAGFTMQPCGLYLKSVEY